MKRKVFSSDWERSNYYKLSRQWGKKLCIYHNLPFLNVLETDDLIDFNEWPLKPIRVEEADRNRLKKTSIDYTLCNEDDAPILCVEFDGLNQGYNVGTRYQTDLPSSPWRKQITELKLKVAFGSMLPYFVVGSQHFEDLSPDLKLTVVDGIIGKVLANKATHEKLAEGFSPEKIGLSQEDFDALSSTQQHELVQDYLWDLETETDLEHNPITRTLADLSAELNLPTVEFRFLSSPQDTSSGKPEERIEGMGKSTVQGAEVTVSLPTGDKIAVRVWLPMFNSPYFGSGLGLAEDIAHLLALIKAREKLRGTKGASSS